MMCKVPRHCRRKAARLSAGAGERKELPASQALAITNNVDLGWAKMVNMTQNRNER